MNMLPTSSSSSQATAAAGLGSAAAKQQQGHHHHHQQQQQQQRSYDAYYELFNEMDGTGGADGVEPETEDLVLMDESIVHHHPEHFHHYGTAHLHPQQTIMRQQSYAHHPSLLLHTGTIDHHHHAEVDAVFANDVGHQGIGHSSNSVINDSDDNNDIDEGDDDTDYDDEDDEDYEESRQSRRRRRSTGRKTLGGRQQKTAAEEKKKQRGKTAAKRSSNSSSASRSSPSTWTASAQQSNHNNINSNNNNNNNGSSRSNNSPVQSGVTGVTPMTVDNAALGASGTVAPVSTSATTAPAQRRATVGTVSRRDCFPTMLYHSGAHVIELPDGRAQCSRCLIVLRSRHSCTQHILHSIRCDANNRQNWPVCPHCSQHITPALISEHLAQCQENAAAASMLANGGSSVDGKDTASMIGVGEQFDGDEEASAQENATADVAGGKRGSRRAKKADGEKAAADKGGNDGKKQKKKVHRRGSERISMGMYLPKVLHKSGAELLEEGNTFRCSKCRHTFGLRGAAKRHIRFSVRCDPKNRENWPRCPSCNQAFQPELFGQHVRKCAVGMELKTAGSGRAKQQGDKAKTTRSRQRKIKGEDDADAKSKASSSKRRRVSTDILESDAEKDDGEATSDSSSSIESPVSYMPASFECTHCGQSHVSLRALHIHQQTSPQCSGASSSSSQR